jgi:hypothetical protein
MLSKPNSKMRSAVFAPGPIEAGFRHTHIIDRNFLHPWLKLRGFRPKGVIFAIVAMVLLVLRRAKTS